MLGCGGKLRQWIQGTLSLNGAKVSQAEKRRWFKYSPKFKQQAVDRMEAGESVSSLAKELGIGRKFFYAWREAGYGSDGPQPPVRDAKEQEVLSESEREAAALKKRVSQLERLVGRQATELDFFGAALRNIEGARPTNGDDSGSPSMPRSKPARKAR